MKSVLKPVKNDQSPDKPGVLQRPRRDKDDRGTNKDGLRAVSLGQKAVKINQATTEEKTNFLGRFHHDPIVNNKTILSPNLVRKHKDGEERKPMSILKPLVRQTSVGPVANVDKRDILGRPYSELEYYIRSGPTFFPQVPSVSEFSPRGELPTILRSGKVRKRSTSPIIDAGDNIDITTKEVRKRSITPDVDKGDNKDLVTNEVKNKPTSPIIDNGDNEDIVISRVRHKSAKPILNTDDNKDLVTNGVKNKSTAPIINNGDNKDIVAKEVKSNKETFEFSSTSIENIADLLFTKFEAKKKSEASLTKQKSPEKSTIKSPKTSPKKSPKLSPKNSPKLSPKNSPKLSPKNSPKTKRDKSPKRAVKKSQNSSPQKSDKNSPISSPNKSTKSPVSSKSPLSAKSSPTKKQAQKLVINLNEENTPIKPVKFDESYLEPKEKKTTLTREVEKSDSSLFSEKPPKKTPTKPPAKVTGGSIFADLIDRTIQSAKQSFAEFFESLDEKPKPVNNDDVKFKRPKRAGKHPPTLYEPKKEIVPTIYEPIEQIPVAMPTVYDKSESVKAKNTVKSNISPVNDNKKNVKSRAKTIYIAKETVKKVPERDYYHPSSNNSEDSSLSPGKSVTRSRWN